MARDAGVEVDLVTMDVADDSSVRAGMATILERAGQIDLLVNNAGIGANAVTEETVPAHLLDMMNVNLCGAVRCIQAVLPGMRARADGCIVNISSVTGRVAAIAQAPYATSKWAMEGMSEGLAQEVAAFGIRVAIVEPGLTKSAIFAKNVDVPNTTGAYSAHYRRMLQFYAVGIANATDPFEVAKVVHHAATTATPRLRYAVSWGGQELISGRARMTDEQWVELGRCVEDGEYYERFRELFGLDVSPS
jgi:NAD(P)-dependent dehydrogenase (short-subunit alcohol dehydrogenase family)